MKRIHRLFYSFSIILEVPFEEIFRQFIDIYPAYTRIQTASQDVKNSDKVENPKPLPKTQIVIIVVNIKTVGRKRHVETILCYYNVL